MPAVGESDASARTCVTSGWRSQWPLPSPRTIAHSARRRQGPGERHEMHCTATFRKRLSPKGSGQHLCLRLLAGSHGFCGMLWDIFPCLHSVPQMVEQLPNILHFFSTLMPDPEQVIKVPKILPDDVPTHRCSRYAAGGTGAGRADDHFLFLVTADCGAARRHSSSWWWRTKFWSSRFFLCTEFNSVAFPNNNNNNNTIWRGSVLAGEEPPPHSGELKHALPMQAAQPNPSFPTLCRQDTTSPWRHRLRRTQLNSDTNASNKKYLTEIQEKKKRRNFFFGKMKKENEKHCRSNNNYSFF